MLDRRFSLMGIAVLLVLAGWTLDRSFGQTSRKLMNLQGRLTDTEGNPTTGQHLFELRIYDTGPAGSGSQLYYETQVVDVNKGIYNILVGDGYNSFTGNDPDTYAIAGGQTGGIPVSVFNRDNLWLEIEIDEDNPLDPRTRVVSSAFSFNADTLDGKDSAAFVEQGGDASFGDTQVNTLSFTGGGDLDSAKMTQLDAILSSGGGGYKQAGLQQSRSGGETFDGWSALYEVSFSKSSGGSTLRFTFSDTLERNAWNAQDCIFRIQVARSGEGWSDVCYFEYEARTSGQTTGNTGRWYWWGSHNSFDWHTHSYEASYTSKLPVTQVCVDARTGGSGNGSARVLGDKENNGTCYFDRFTQGGLLVVDEVN